MVLERLRSNPHAQVNPNALFNVYQGPEARFEVEQKARGPRN